MLVYLLNSVCVSVQAYNLNTANKAFYNGYSVLYLEFCIYYSVVFNVLLRVCFSDS